MARGKKEDYVAVDVELLEKDIKEAGYGITEIAKMVRHGSSWFAGVRDARRITIHDLEVISLVLKQDKDHYVAVTQKEVEAPESNRGGFDEAQVLTMLLNIANAVSDLREITKQILEAIPEQPEPDRAEALTPVPRTDRERLAQYLHKSFAGTTAGVKVKDFKQGLKTAKICTTGMREIIKDEGFEIVAGGNGEQWIVKRGK